VIRVGLVTDSPVVHAGLRALLAAEPDFAFVEAPIGPHDDLAHGSVDVVAPEAEVIVWVPTHFDAGDAVVGVEGELDASPLQRPIVALLPAVDASLLADAVRAGVRAVLPVDAERDELVAAIRAVAAGLAAVPQAPLLDLVAIAPARESASTIESDSTPPLTHREREVLALLVDGRANKVIAARLGISEHTVKTHIAALYEKLRARNRAEAVVAAARRGLVIL